jgi:hypothetical protein
MSTLIPAEQMHEVLRQHHGANAVILQYTASLRRIALRLYWPRQSEKDLFIVGAGCRHISGPFSWEDNRLEMAEWDPMGGARRLIDPIAGFELRSDGGAFLVDVKEPFDLDKPMLDDEEV